VKPSRAQFATSGDGETDSLPGYAERKLVTEIEELMAVARPIRAKFLATFAVFVLGTFGIGFWASWGKSWAWLGVPGLFLMFASVGYVGCLALACSDEDILPVQLSAEIARKRAKLARMERDR
jgi:hypothetical protein